MNEREQSELILRGLVGDDPRRQFLYNNSAKFHAEIKALSELLVEMVDGIALHAEQSNLTIKQQTEMILRQQMTL